MKIPPFPVAECRRLIEIAVREDIGTGDITTAATVDAAETAHGRIVARDPCVIAGLEAAAMVFATVDDAIAFEPEAADGAMLDAGALMARLSGPARSILSAERVALNFLQRLSGIATATARYVEQTRPHGVEVLDTRKTTPGWRSLEKYAVAVGGGRNHRYGLFDQFLIKENHIRLVARGDADPVARAVERARAAAPDLDVEVEVETLEELDQALAVEADIILLDNMDLHSIREAVRRTGGRALLEVSGGVTLENIAGIAATGVDYVSVGWVTHSAPAVDISLELEP